MEKRADTLEVSFERRYTLDQTDLLDIYYDMRKVVSDFLCSTMDCFIDDITEETIDKVLEKIADDHIINWDNR